MAILWELSLVTLEFGDGNQRFRVLSTHKFAAGHKGASSSISLLIQLQRQLPISEV